MKKTEIVIFSLITFLFLTGCSGKTLKCNYENETSGVKMNGKIVATINDTEVTKLKFVVTTEATTELTKSFWGYLKPSIEEVKEKDLTIKGIEDEKNYKYTMSVEAKGSKVSTAMTSEYSELGKAFSGGKTYDEIKNAVEAFGYKCN